MKLITGIINFVVLESVSATIEVDINNQAIEKVGNDAAHFEQRLQQSQKFHNFTEAIHDAQVESSIDIWNSQRQILKPAVKALNMYLKLYSPGPSCQPNAFSQCLINDF